MLPVPVCILYLTCTVNPPRSDHPLVQINVVFLDRWSLFTVQFLCKHDWLCTKKRYLQASGRVRQVLLYVQNYRKRGSASYIVREWLLWVVERERETPVTSSISRWNREWSCMWLPRQRVDPMHMHTRRRVLSLQLLSSAQSAWQAKPQTATLATAQWPK